MNIDYYGVILSPNIARTPEGYVICKDVVIGRTGYQEYRVSQLPKAYLRELGLLDRFSDPDEVVKVWRDPSQVFAPDTIASYEGKPATDNHPIRMVDAESHADVHRGHVQNIRRGDEALDSGDIPMLADLIITDPELGDDVLNNHKRELSCGYTYGLAWDGNQLSQINITGNHVAVVPKGRAGAEARIYDSADIPQPKRKIMNILKHIKGLGLKAYAQDAEPEALADAMKECAADEDKVEEKESPKAEEKKAEDADPLAEIKDSLKSICDRLDKLEQPEEEAEDEKDESEDDEESEEEAEEAESEDEEDHDGEGKDAFIEPAVSESDLLKVLKPMIARSNDAALKSAFNKVIGKANDSLKGGTPKGAYGAVKSAAGKKSASALDSQDAQAAYYARLNERSQANFNGQKEVK